MRTINILPFTVAGIYKIHCIKTGGVYIGESDNCAYRIAQHKKELSLNKYQKSNPDLQSDWNAYGESYFESYLLFANEECSNNEYRKQKELIFLKQVPDHLRYNVRYRGSERNNFMKFFVISYHGIIYNNLRKLLQVCNRDLVKKNLPKIGIRKLNTILVNGLSLEELKPFEKVVYVNNQIYPSINHVVKAKLAKTSQEVEERIHDERFNWFYIDTFAKKKNLRIMVDQHLYSSVGFVIKNGLASTEDEVYERLVSEQYPNWYWLYKLSPEFETRKSNLKSYSRLKGIMAKGHFFESASAVVKAGLATSENMVRKRIYKKHYPDYYYVDTDIANRGRYYRKIVVPDGRQFDTIKQLVEAKLVKDRHDLYRKMNHPATKNAWFYLDTKNHD